MINRALVKSILANTGCPNSLQTVHSLSEHVLAKRPPKLLTHTRVYMCEKYIF